TAPNAGSLRVQRRDDRCEKLIGHSCPFCPGKILLVNRLRRMCTHTEKTAATLKCTHVAVSGFAVDAPNQSRVVRIILRMNRCRRTERDEVVSVCVRLCTRVLNVYVQFEKKIVLLLARLQQRKFLSNCDSVRRGALAPNAAVGFTH